MQTLFKYIAIAISLFLPSVASALQSKTTEQKRVDLFVEAAMPKSGFAGETSEYIVTLYSSSPDVADVRILDMPVFPESVTTLQGVVRNQRPSQVKIKGRTYYGWTILRMFITPSESGRVTVDGGKYLAYIGKERIVDDYFWGRRRVRDYDEYMVTGKSSEIKVNALPEFKMQGSFSGVIGEFSVEGWFPPGEIRVGSEAIAVFTISGFGLLEDLKMPDLTDLFTDGCRLREVSRDDEVSQKDGRLFSEVTLTCRFIPEDEDGVIGPLKICVYNPKEKRYEYVESFPLRWSGRKMAPSSVSPREVYEI